MGLLSLPASFPLPASLPLPAELPISQLQSYMNRWVLTVSVAVVAIDGTGVVTVTAVVGAGVSVSITRDDGGSITVESGVTVAGH